MAVFVFVLLMILFLPFAIYQLKLLADNLMKIVLPRSSRDFKDGVKLSFYHFVLSLVILSAFFITAYTANYIIESLNFSGV